MYDKVHNSLLDEVAKEGRAACIQAINSYYQDRVEQGSGPLVVCCRSKEYLTLSTQVTLNQAVSIQPLTDNQIDQYLQSASGQLEALRRVLYDNPVLQELMTTPLMLSVLTMVYYGKSIEYLRTIGPVESQRQILTAYVQRMLQRREVETHFTQEQTIYWLAWLARQMAQHSQTEFYIERMQVDWLPKNWPRLIYCLLVCIICSLSGGLLTGIVGKLIDGANGWFVGGLLFGLVGGLVLQAEIDIKPAEALAWSWRSAWQGLLKGFVFVVIGALCDLTIEMSLLVNHILSSDWLVKPIETYA